MSPSQDTKQATRFLFSVVIYSTPSKRKWRRNRSSTQRKQDVDVKGTERTVDQNRPCKCDARSPTIIAFIKQLLSFATLCKRNCPTTTDVKLGSKTQCRSHGALWPTSAWSICYSGQRFTLASDASLRAKPLKKTTANALIIMAASGNKVSSSVTTAVK